MSFYAMQAPTEWVDPPTTWSSTTIDDVDACPRRWQLLRSRWGDYERFPVRPSPAAIEGQIVHDALDRLTGACGKRGNPPFGHAEFSAALADADFFPGFARAVAEWQQRLNAHPRPGPPFRLRASAEELANRAVRLFREQYKPDELGASPAAERVTEAPKDLKGLVRQKRALSEVRLTHPELPFLGVLDRVHAVPGGVEIVDFKTGKPSDKHGRQLLRYALLWWRSTGEMPARVVAQYLDGVESWLPTEEVLTELERGLARSITLLSNALRAGPAEAKPGEECRVCPVRARCGPGWAVAEDAVLGEIGDSELSVIAKAGAYGFLGRSRGGAEVAVVYEAAVAELLPELAPGQLLRVLGGRWEKRSQLEIRPWTEVFIVADQ